MESANSLDLSIVIVNWNSQAYLKKCLASIEAHTRGITCEIVVIDTASFDGCDRMLHEHYPHVRFIQSASNLGFAKANNRAFQQSSGKAVLFLNPDTELIGPAIDTLHSALNSLPDCGLVGGRLLNSDGTVQSSCISSMPTILNKILDSEFLKARWPGSGLWGIAPLYRAAAGACEVEAISGACLMAKRSTLEQVGGFSEDYFMYAEDVDLSYKVRAAGYRNYYVPDATVIHHGGSSSGQAVSTFSAVMMREATWRFLRKTRGGAYGLGYRLGMFVSALGRLLVLGFSLPFRMSGHGNARWRASVRKWLAVLRWTVDRDDLVKAYYPSRPGDSGSGSLR